MQVLLESDKQDSSNKMKHIFEYFIINNLNYDGGKSGKEGV